MTLDDVCSLRLKNQKIALTEFNTPKEIVRWMGAMQAQDFAMARWAVGLRLKNSTESFVLEAYNNGEILRAHLMRPTWHLIAAEDIYWMLQLTGPRIKQQLKSRHRELELSDDIITKSFQIIENTLSTKNYTSREDLTKGLGNADIRTNENRMSHILMSAELEGIICSGPVVGKKITYALLPERVAKKKILSREESLSELARRYFQSHSPATVKDFAWWSGLSLKDAGLGLESLKNDFHPETINNEKYWFPASPESKKKNSSSCLLPAYDEYLISYQNRSAAMKLTEQKVIISINGIFHPTVLINGQVNGLWRKAVKNNVMAVEMEIFSHLKESEKEKLANEANRLGNFFGMKATVKFV